MSRMLEALLLVVSYWILCASSAEAGNRTRIVIRETPPRTVQRIVEVPVERIVEVPVERTVERIFEVPVTRYVEVPTTRSVVVVEPAPTVIVAPRRAAFFPR